MDRRAVVLDREPLRVEIEEFEHHEDEVFETQPIVPVRQGRRIGRSVIRPKRVVDQSTISAAHDLRWIERRADHHPRIGQAGIAQLGQALQRRLEHPLEMLVERYLRCGQRSKRVKVLALLLEVPAVEAAQHTGEVLGTCAARTV